MRRLRQLTLGVVLVCALNAREAAAGAITVRNVTLNTTIFLDDGFEDDAVGATAPNAPMIGSYAQGATGKTIVDSTTAPVPGPYDGANYFKHMRVNSPTDYQYVRFFDNTADNTVMLEEELEATFALNVTPTSYADISLYWGGSILVAQILAQGSAVSGGQPWRIFAEGSGATREFPALPDATNTWREVKINFSSTVFRLTVDGQSYDYASPWDSFLAGAGGIDRFTLNPGSAGSTYYLDAIPSAPSFLADFEPDGDVDADDLSTWKTNFPVASGATHAQGDANGDGSVDGADFMIWQQELSSGPVAAAVPEPAASLLFGVGSLMLLQLRRRS